jgi:hypothetical protein
MSIRRNARAFFVERIREEGGVEETEPAAATADSRGSLGLGAGLGRSQTADWLQLGGFLCLRAKLNDLSASPPRFPFQRCPQVRRDIKINHLRHKYLLRVRILVEGLQQSFTSNTPPP